MKKIIKYDLNKDIRLDKYLTDQFPDISRTKIQKIINQGAVLVDDYIVKSSYKIKNNQIISIKNFDLKEEDFNVEPQNIKLDVIYEDDQIMVVNKESGMVVHPGIGNKDQTMLNGLLYHSSNLSNIPHRPGIIHRLDKETTGVIVFAKTDKAHYFISEQFANRKIFKQYKAVVWGDLSNSVTIDKNLIRDRKNRLRFRVSESKGKKSLSICEPVKNDFIPITEVDVYPKTGRTHQIRVHLSSIGHPILQDDLYNGGEKNVNSFHQKYKKNISDIVKCIDRVALHAYKIEFEHPTLKERVMFEAPLPYDISHIIKTINECK